jgi:hypothetical protein
MPRVLPFLPKNCVTASCHYKFVLSELEVTLGGEDMGSPRRVKETEKLA